MSLFQAKVQSSYIQPNPTREVNQAVTAALGREEERSQRKAKVHKKPVNNNFQNERLFFFFFGKTKKNYKHVHDITDLMIKKEDLYKGICP